MGTTNHILRFDRPLEDVICGTARGPSYNAADVARLKAEAYEQGQLAQRAFTDGQIAELRTEVQQLQRGLFARLGNIETDLLEQLQNGLPDLVLDLARRLLAGFQPSPDDVQRICRNAMEELMPARDGLELVVGEEDARILESVEESWKTSWPGLHIRIDRGLKSGECLVHSRFGVVDGRHQPRLDALLEELGGGRTR